MKFRFVVHGEPRPKARPRFGKGRAFTDADTVAYECKVAFYARAARVQKLSGPVVLGVNFYLGNKRRVDCDNLLKALKDALNGVAWGDDSQVVELHASKSVDPSDPRTVVTVEEQLCKTLVEVPVVYP
jgi:Holliday junction resolvase RusA-like endonuclease